MQNGPWVKCLDATLGPREVKFVTALLSAYHYFWAKSIWIKHYLVKNKYLVTKIINNFETKIRIKVVDEKKIAKKFFL